MKYKKLAATLWNQSKNFNLYVIIGGTALLVELGSYFILSRFFANAIVIDNAIAMLLGMFTSFSLNSRYNFQVRDRMPLRFLGFATVTFVSYMVSTVILYQLTRTLAIDSFIAKLITAPVVLAIQYTLNKRFTFNTGLTEDLVTNE